LRWDVLSDSLINAIRHAELNNSWLLADVLQKAEHIKSAPFATLCLNCCSWQKLIFNLRLVLISGIDETIKAVQAVGGNAVGYMCDLSNRSSIYENAEKVKREVGKVRKQKAHTHQR
jgi:hypothetical protein